MPAHSSSHEEMEVEADTASQSASPHHPAADSPPGTFDKSGARNETGTFNHYENVHIKTERTLSRNSCTETSPKRENEALTTPPPPPPPPPSSSSHPVASMPSTKCEILRLVKSANDELQVCCTIPLAKGSCLGPFYGDVTDEDAADTLLQFTEDNGNTVHVRLLEESASWLKLLSKSEKTPKNCIVFYEAGRIWCRLTVDLTPESALAASFTFLSNQSQSPKGASANEKDRSPAVGTGAVGMHTSNAVAAAVAAAATIKREETETSKHAINLPGANTEIPVFSALIYQCPYCGVRFSKPSTLEGHLLYYCSKKPPPSSSSTILTPNETASNNNTPAINTKKRERNSPSTGSDDENSKKMRLESEQPVSEADESDTCTESGSPLPKAIKTGELYQCPCCSYSAEKLSGLNRHRRIHNRPSKDSQETPPKSVLKSETFCKECNIQFSSFNTYRGHKKFYCARRNKDVPNEGSPVAPSKADAVRVQSPVTSLTPVTHHVTSIPFHVTANSSVLSTQTAVIMAAPILTANGMPSLAFTVPTVIVQPVVTSANLTQPVQAHQAAIPLSSSSKDQPLDLSTKKEDGKGDEKNAAARVSPISSETSETRNHVKEEPIDATGRKSASENSSSSSIPLTAVPTAAGASSNPWPSVETSVLNQLFNHNINQYPHQPKQIITSPTGQAPVSTNVSKCLECNIVFYKHENFVAHKQHYCASRRAVKTSPQISPKLSPREADAASSAAAAVVAAVATTSSLRRPSPELTSRPLSSSANNEEKLEVINNVSKMATLPNEAVEKGKTNVSYFCVPCKIKFSSASTLKAHKDYYCPHGKNSEQSLILCKNDSVSEGSCSEADDNSLEESFYTCTHCCTSYTSSRLYRHHYCPANMQNPMVRCPHCDYVAPTQNKLSEHMKAHATSRGYKCLLCGYRGNTVRGMRMHGKTHTDSGQEFSEKHVLEVEEPPVLPVSYKNGTTETYGSMDVEAELIRLKNEPYKRRRSRKSYERMDIPNHELLHACKICGETFTDLNAFQIHSTIHQTTPMVSHTIGRSKSIINGKHMDDHQADIGPSNELASASRVEPGVSSTLPVTASAAAASGSSTSVYLYNDSMDSKASLKYITEKMDSNLIKSAKLMSPISPAAATTTPPPATAMHFKHEADPDPKINSTNCSPKRLHRFQDAESPKPAGISASYSGTIPTDLKKTANSLGSVIHIKPEPIDRGYDKAENGTASVDSPPPATSIEVNVKKEIDQSTPCERKEAMIPQSSLQEGAKVLSHSKLEIPSHSLSPPSTLPIPPSSPCPTSPSSSSKTAASTAFATTTSATASSSNTTPLYVYNSQYLQGEKTDHSNHVAEPQLSKYCQQCDISFTYLATFLAHKKHYCSARLPENKPSVTA